MKKLTRNLAIVLMTMGIIVLTACQKNETNQTDGAESVNTVWKGGGNCSFDYEGEHFDVHLSSRIAIGENEAMFRLEGLPEGTINRRVGCRWREYFDFDGNHVPFSAYHNGWKWCYMDVALNSGVAPHCDPKTQALFDQNDNRIYIHLEYVGDSLY